MKRLLPIFIILLFIIGGRNLFANPPSVTGTTSKNVKVPVQPPSKRVLRALGYYTIFSVQRRKIFFDAGKDDNIPPGAEVKIYRQVLRRNPVTGKVYTIKKLIGIGRVRSVDTDYSIAHIKRKYTKIRIGDLVKVNKFIQPEIPFYQKHEIFYSIRSTNFQDLTNYLEHSFGFIYAISSLRVGIKLDYLITRPERRTIFLTNYIFQFITTTGGISISPIFCIASNNVTWGTQFKFILGNPYSTHLSFSYLNVNSVGWETSLEGAFRLTNHFVIASETFLTTLPDESDKKLITQIKFTGIFKSLSMSIAGGFGGINADQLGPYVSAKLALFIGGE